MPHAFPTAPPGTFMLDGNKPEPHGYGINWGDPQARGLKAYYPLWAGAGSQVQDLVDPAGRLAGTIGGSGWVWAIGKDGQSLQNNGAGDEITFTALPSMTDWTCALRADIRTNSSALFGVVNRANSNSSLMTIRPSLGMFVYLGSTAKEVWTPPIGTGLHTFVTQRQGTNVLGWIDGQLGSIVDSTGLTFDWPSMDSLVKNWITPIDISVFSVAIWDRALATSEIKDFSENPYRLITPGEQVLPVTVAAGHPTMRRWRNVAYMTPGPFSPSRI